MAITLGPQKKFTDALIRARAIGANDLDRITRILIDIKPGKPVVMTVEYLGDESVHAALSEVADQIEKG